MDLEILAHAVEENPHDITIVLVLADCIQEHGWTDTAQWIRGNGCDVGIGIGDGSGGSGGSGGFGDVGFGDGGDVGDGGDGGFGDVGDGGFGDVGDVGDGGFGDGGTGSGGNGDVGVRNFNGAFIMQNGFYIITVRGGYYPYVLVGWFKRHDFLLQALNTRIIRRFGNLAQLSKIAKTGPIKEGKNPTQLLDLSEEEWIPLGSVGRIIVGDGVAWQAECPKPYGM